ncbi:cytochrome P450 [Byssothecium circinans]|uniref:Cytochrome P450 n=1 Tax=Byssothecium circinans TaxID=147558 RepID=A0A6A5TWU2_9PLEO|nr:cytochrome P450 [Byssothecium circinans]
MIPIPFIGHALGLLVYRNHYYTKISRQWNLPIISLPIFGGNVYVTKSPSLIYSLQRQPKSLSFWYFEAQFTAKLGGLSQAGTNACLRGLRPGSTDESTVIGTLKGERAALSPQGDLNRMVKVATGVMGKSIEALAQESEPQIDLESWIQHEITIATTDAIYGASNPYHDPKVEAGFWKFANATMFIALPSILPKILAPRAVAGREAVVRAIHQYYTSGAHHHASQLTMSRYTSVKDAMNTLDIARSECVHGLAMITNTVPAAFWTIWHVFSDPAMLSRVREEVESFTVVKEPRTGGGGQMRIVDMSRLKEAHFLLSVIQETLRFRARGTGPRMVLEDTTLTGEGCEYRLEKDSVLIIAHEGMHHDKDVWGPDADIFVAGRFLPGNKTKVPANAFRGFGGGANMCPGKGFAVAEIAAMVVMLAVRFELRPVGGRWVEPGQDEGNVARENTPPLGKVGVSVGLRDGVGEVQWKFTV